MATLNRIRNWERKESEARTNYLYVHIDASRWWVTWPRSDHTCDEEPKRPSPAAVAQILFNRYFTLVEAAESGYIAHLPPTPSSFEPRSKDRLPSILVELSAKDIKPEFCQQWLILYFLFVHNTKPVLHVWKQRLLWIKLIELVSKFS